MEVIPTGSNLWQYDQPVLDDPRVALQIAPTTNVLLSLSRIAFEKKIDEVIAALPAILAVVPNTVLVIVGDGPARETLQNQAKSLGIWEHVIFTGEVPNEHVAAYYHMADLFLSASESESQGLTYIEAMASGLKSVAAASPYTNDLLDDPAIGTTFTSEPEMVQQVTRYLAHPQVFNDPSPRLRKLELISAPHFGHRVIQFYRTAQTYYETLNRDSTKLSD